METIRPFDCKTAPVLEAVILFSIPGTAPVVLADYKLVIKILTYIFKYYKLIYYDQSREE